MPSIVHIAAALNQYAGRYPFLDAFVDDVDEFRLDTWRLIARVNATAPRPRLSFNVAGQVVVAELFQEQGVARFALATGNDQTVHGVATGTAIGGLVGGALGAASKAKGGLLGGLILGMLVGGFVGAASSYPVERVLTLQYDPTTMQWRLYDGPLLQWAKQRLTPS